MSNPIYNSMQSTSRPKVLLSLLNLSISSKTHFLSVGHTLTRLVSLNLVMFFSVSALLVYIVRYDLHLSFYGEMGGLGVSTFCCLCVSACVSVCINISGKAGIEIVIFSFHVDDEIFDNGFLCVSLSSTDVVFFLCLGWLPIILSHYPVLFGF